jgi:hypothetical protein
MVLALHMEEVLCSSHNHGYHRWHHPFGPLHTLDRQVAEDYP